MLKSGDELDAAGGMRGLRRFLMFVAKTVSREDEEPKIARSILAAARAAHARTIQMKGKKR